MNKINSSVQEVKIVAYIKLKMPANTAINKDPIGPALGQYGLSGGDFCNKFNEVSKLTFIDNCIVNVVITYYDNFKYDFIIKGPHLGEYFNRVMEIKDYKGSKKPGKSILILKDRIAIIVPTVLYEILNYHYSKQNIIVNYSLYRNAMFSLKSKSIVFFSEFFNSFYLYNKKIITSELL